MSEEIQKIAMLIYDAIFEDKSSVEIEGEKYRIETTLKSKVRLVKYGGLTFIEQNPFKSSQWGKEAREGHQIM
ncbi:MAG: hypothetical protein ACFFEL_17625 [Candidatus Thorarchaeota archaeon]